MVLARASAQAGARNEKTRGMPKPIKTLTVEQTTQLNEIVSATGLANSTRLKTIFVAHFSIASRRQEAYFAIRPLAAKGSATGSGTGSACGRWALKAPHQRIPVPTGSHVSTTARANDSSSTFSGNTVCSFDRRMTSGTSPRTHSSKNRSFGKCFELMLA